MLHTCAIPAEHGPHDGLMQAEKPSPESHSVQVMSVVVDEAIVDGKLECRISPGTRHLAGFAS